MNKSVGEVTTSTGKVFQTEIEWEKNDMLQACVLEKGLQVSYDMRPHDWGIQ